MSRRSAGWVMAAMAAGFAGSALYHVLIPTVPVAMAAEPAGLAEVRATRFVLVDSQNRTRATIGTYQPVYAAGDKAPPPVKEMVGIVIYDEDGKPGIQLGRGGAVARLEMQGDAGWMTLGVHPDGGGVGIWVPEETLRFGFGMQKDGNGGFVLNDVRGRERFSGGMPPEGGVSLSLKESSGRPTWKAP